jgi:hypothetical protein
MSDTKKKTTLFDDLVSGFEDVREWVRGERALRVTRIDAETGEVASCGMEKSESGSSPASIGELAQNDPERFDPDHRD